MAEQLGKFHWELLQLPIEEYENWCHYFRYKYEQEKKQMNSARKKSKRKR